MKRFFLFLVLVVGTGCFVNYQLPPEKVDKVADTVVADSQWETTLHNLLQTHVDTDGYVHYSNLEKEIARLHGIRKFWETVSPTTWSQEKQLAFWINVYNVMMWFNILEKKPTKVSEFNAYFFNEKKFWVANTALSLDQIENQIIRKVDPKSPANAFTLKTLYPEIHAAVSCAAISCPPLWNQVWKEDNVMATLKERFALLVNRSKFVRILDGKPEVSKIFEWFYIDFSQEGKTPGEWLSQFIKDKKVSDTVKAAKTAKDFVFMEYDWTVNDQKNKK